nr:beta-N-acetylhexosaminidase [Neokomagataea thailandica]
MALRFGQHPLLAKCRYLFLSSAALGMFYVGGVSGACAEDTRNLMPVPEHVTWGKKQINFSAIQIAWDKPATPLMREAGIRFERRLTRLIGRTGGPVFTLHIRAGSDPDFLTLKEREAYHLEAGAQGGILTADGPAGILHGLATLLQMVERGPRGASLQEGKIEDGPRFAWRGVLLDVSRHFVTIETLKRQLDAMELVKLNVLHWHLSDGTGFRVESRVFPEINRIGPYYTQDQVREIVAYAAARGIRVVPEIDVPGHAYAILRAYPNLSAEPLPKVEYAGEKANIPAMDPTNPATLKFVKALYSEMETLFPDVYFHAGGDEVMEKQWTENARIQAYMKAHDIPDAAALQGEFTAEVARLLHDQGRIMIGWDEVSTAPVPKDVVIEGWRGSKWTARAIRSGHDVLVSSGYYLDLMRPSAAHYTIDPYDVLAEGLTPSQIQEARPKPSALIDAFSQNPAEQPLTQEGQAHVLGVEEALWTELVSDQMIDERLWPRSAAVAERFWSSPTLIDVSDMHRRLKATQTELEETGLQSEAHVRVMRLALTGGHPDAALNSVLDALVPAQNYVLNRLHDKKGLDVEHSPAGVVDPDSWDVLQFNELAARFANGDTTAAPELKKIAGQWFEASKNVQITINTYPALKDLSSTVQDLSSLSGAVLAKLDGSARPSDTDAALQRQETWAHNTSNMLLSVRRPQAPGGVYVGGVSGFQALLH